MNIQINLSIDEVNHLLSVLGDLPTKVGVWELFAKIKNQGEEQWKASQESK